MTKQTKYVPVATKLSEEAYDQLNRIAKRQGTTVYELMQNFCSMIIRYCSDQHNLTPEMEKAMSAFQHLGGWRDALNLADPAVEMKVGEATYYLVDKAGHKHGKIAVHVQEPWLGRWSQTENAGTILERTLENLVPETYRRLRALAVERGNMSIMELLYDLVDNAEREDVNADIRRGFEDCNRSDYGKPIAYGERTRRKHHRAAEDYEYKQQTIHFDPDCVPDLPEIREAREQREHDDNHFDPDKDAFG